MDIVKKIKRGYLIVSGPKQIKIDPTLSITDIKGGSGGAEKHKLLKANAMTILITDSNEVIDELGNFDVVDLKNGIVVECGRTSSRKLLDSFSEIQEKMKKINQFWILQISDSSNISNCYKFKKTSQYR